VKQVDKVLDSQPDRRSLRKQDLDMAMNLIESMSTEWDPKRYHDSYTERVNELVEAKSRDEKFEAPEEEPSAKVIDLTAALQASIDRVRGGGSAKKGSGQKSSGSKVAGTGRQRLVEDGTVRTRPAVEDQRPLVDEPQTAGEGGRRGWCTASLLTLP
jgi:DNA end-binding protein Ku